MLNLPTPFDNGGAPGGSPAPNTMGCGRARQCSEVLAGLWSVFGKTTGWGEVSASAQIDFTGAYDSALRTEVADAMQKRGVPPPVVGVGIHE